MMKLDGRNVPTGIKEMTINGGHISYTTMDGKHIVVEDWESRSKILQAIWKLEAVLKEVVSEK